MSPSEAAEELEGVQSDLRKRETEVIFVLINCHILWIFNIKQIC